MTSKCTLLTVLVVEIDMYASCQGTRRERFARGWESLADGAHGPVLQLFKKQNRELPYASVGGGKPAKGPGLNCFKGAEILKSR